MKERFRPVSNTRHETFFGKIKFYGRVLLDLQFLTIYRDIKNTIPGYRGNVLDLGCGQSPYKYLLHEDETLYYGIDIVDAKIFDYKNSEITPFNGRDIPFENGLFDALICTEVLEHVEHYQHLIDEMFRVMKTGAEGIITIPWSARYHYIPHDYFRYSPSALKTMFSKFAKVKITNRGMDIAVITNKLIVLWMRNLFPIAKARLIFVPFWLLFCPILIPFILISHIALVFDLGIDNDPLGYTIFITK